MVLQDLMFGGWGPPREPLPLEEGMVERSLSATATPPPVTVYGERRQDCRSRTESGWLSEIGVPTESGVSTKSGVATESGVSDCGIASGVGGHGSWSDYIAANVGGSRESESDFLYVIDGRCESWSESA